MCGRFSLIEEAEDVAAFFDIESFGNHPLRYNIAPTQPILTVGINGAGHRAAVLMRWGLIPQWVKDPDDFTLLINARSETAATKPSFRTAIRHGRVLIPASGFYEWHRPADKKQPKQAYWIRPAEGGMIAFGGLTETWMGKDGTEIDTACILTTESNAQIGNIHHRMTVIIRPEDFDRWLDCRNHGPKDVEDLLSPVEDGFFEAVAVSDAVNKVANNGPEIQKPAKAERQVNQEPADKKKDDGQMDLF